MYKFVKTISGNKDVGVFASILYMTFPYHLTDLYTRNALGEYVSFIFIPLVFLGLYKILFSEEKNCYLILGAAGLILTHNLSTIIVAIFAIIYLLCNIKNIKNKKILKQLIINAIFIISITSYFWIPMIETKIGNDYQVYREGMMATPESAADNALEIKQLFVTMNDGNYVFELGPHVLIMLALSIMTFRFIRPEFKKQYTIFFVCSLITLWMSTKYFPWRYLPNCFSIIQFPWRMLMMSAFFLSVVCAINMYAIIKKFNFKDVIVLSAISILYVIAISNLIVFYTEEPLSDINEYYTGQYSGRNNEVVIGCGKGEYLTAKANNRRFYIASREKGMYVLYGKKSLMHCYLLNI